MDGIDGLQPLPKGPGIEQQIEIPTLKIRLDQVNIGLSMNPDGSETQVKFTWLHPMFPIQFEVPFQQLFYLDRFIENLQTLREKAEAAQNPTS